MVCVHIFAETLYCLGSTFLEAYINILFALRHGNYAVKILFRHGDGAADKVAQIVCEVVIVAGYNVLVCDRAV